MAERFKAAVLKTVERKLRGFESLSLRQLCRPFAGEGNENATSVFRKRYGEVAERLKAAAC